MKIVFTIADASGLIHAGLDVERESFIIEVPDESIPIQVKKLLEYRRERRKSNLPINDYSSISLSFLEGTEEGENKNA